MTNEFHREVILLYVGHPSKYNPFGINMTYLEFLIAYLRQIKTIDYAQQSFCLLRYLTYHAYIKTTLLSLQVKLRRIVVTIFQHDKQTFFLKIAKTN